LKHNLYIIFKTLALAVAFVFLLFIASCDNEEYNVISGTLSDMTTGEPVAGAKVEFEITEIISGNYNSAFKPFKETYTNQDGTFSMEFESRNFVKLRLKFSKEGYHTVYNTFEPTNVDSDYVITDIIPKESYINVRVYNGFPNDPDDVVKIRLLNVNSDCNVCCGPDFRYYYGAYVDTSFVCKVVGGESITLNYISIHNDESNIVESQIYCTPGDTVMYNCYY
jgi:hypothetical protein